MAQFNYSTSDDQYFHQDSMNCNMAPTEFLTTLDEMYMDWNVVTSPNPTTYNLMDSTTKTSDSNTHIMRNLMNDETECQLDPSNFVSENSLQFTDSGNSGNISTYAENNFPAFCHSNYPSPAQTDLVTQAPSSFNIPNLDSHNMLYQSHDVDQQDVLPPSLPPIRSFGMLPIMSLHRYHYENSSTPPLETSSAPKLLLPQPIYEKQVKELQRRPMCTICNINFSNLSNLTRHYKTKNHKKAEFSAIPDLDLLDLLLSSSSPKSSPSSPASLASSTTISTIDEQESAFYCKPCNRTFGSSGHFKQHNNAVHSEKPYKCSKCGKRFKSLINHDQHKARHEGTKRFKCDTCTKEFNYRVDLRRHQMSHTGKTHACGLCKKSFTRRDHLVYHMTAIHYSY